ncbi:MAG: sulfotransferase [Tateyamaria sp.]|uniref:sulfotransferase n=1 Tax=Roseobacteraceae TaxID=2854170 RepID=UPI0032992D56
MVFSTKPIILHAGFHKTGTSSLQQTLKANRAVLKRTCNIVLKFRLQEILRATRGYSTWRDPLSLAKISHRADTWLTDQPDYRHRGLIASAEEFVGHMPGREGVDDYSASLTLLPDLLAAFQRRYEHPDLHIVFTTRQPDTWLHSAYWEHVKSSSMTMSLDAFLRQFSQAAEFSPLLDQLAERIAPVPLHRIALEDWRHTPLGLAEPVVALAGYPAQDMQNLTPIAPVNTRLPNEALQELLDLNRNISDREARNQAKQALMARFDT